MNVTDPAFHLTNPASPIWQVTNTQGGPLGSYAGNYEIFAVHAILIVLIIVVICVAFTRTGGSEE